MPIRGWRTRRKEHQKSGEEMRKERRDSHLKYLKLQLLKAQKKMKNSSEKHQSLKQAHAANYKADQSDRKSSTKLEFTAKARMSLNGDHLRKIM